MISRPYHRPSSTNIRLFKQLSALDKVKVACLADRRPLFGAQRVEAMRRGGAVSGWRGQVLDATNNHYDWWRALLLTPALGFSVEGYARDSLYVGGAWRDHVLMARLNPDPRFQPLRG